MYPVLMIRTEVLQIFIFCKFNEFSIMYNRFVCPNLIWPDIAMLNLAGKCFVTGRYHKPCVCILNLEHNAEGILNRIMKIMGIIT